MEKIYCKDCELFQKSTRKYSSYEYYYCNIQPPQKKKYINKYTGLIEEEIDREWYKTFEDNFGCDSFFFSREDYPRHLNRKNNCAYFIQK